MPIHAEKISEMCEKYGNMRNTRQSHIRIKLTCLTMRPDIKRQTDRHTQRERERERWETGSIPGFHGVGVPAVVGLLGRWHQSVILPRLRDHCDNSLANTHTHMWYIPMAFDRPSGSLIQDPIDNFTQNQTGRSLVLDFIRPLVWWLASCTAVPVCFERKTFNKILFTKGSFLGTHTHTHI